MTLELWSDPENDGELSCCSAQAVRGARDLAHGLGMPHLSIDLRAEFRAGVVDGWLADHAAGLTPNPCVRCNGKVRLDAMLELAERLGARALATGHYARVDSEQALADPLLRMAADAGKDQSYVLCALAPRVAGAAALPAGRPAQAPGAGARRAAGLAVAPKPRFPGPLLPRRHPPERLPGAPRRTWRRGRGRSSTCRGGHLGEHSGTPRLHGRASATASASQPDSRCMSSPPTPAPTPSLSVPARSCLTRELAVRDADPPPRGGSRVDGVRVRAHGRRFACRLTSRRGWRVEHERVALELGRGRPSGRLPGRSPACTAGTWSSAMHDRT